VPPRFKFRAYVNSATRVVHFAFDREPTEEYPVYTLCGKLARAFEPTSGPDATDRLEQLHRVVVAAQLRSDLQRLYPAASLSEVDEALNRMELLLDGSLVEPSARIDGMLDAGPASSFRMGRFGSTLCRACDRSPLAKDAIRVTD
jgi:hypothetical protein